MVADTADRAVAARVALVAGTGLVGQVAARADKTYKAVHCVGRRKLSLQHPKLEQHVGDLHATATFAGLPHIDDCFIALCPTQ